MRPTGTLVHLRARRLALFVAAQQQLHDGVLVADHELLVADGHLTARLFRDLRLDAGVQQVVKFLVVDLNVTDTVVVVLECISDDTVEKCDVPTATGTVDRAVFRSR